MRISCVLALIFSLVSPVALASETRMITLRHSPGLIDETDVYEFPAAIVEHSLALVELGTAAHTDVYGGVLKTFSGSGAGVVLSRDDTVMTEVSASQFSLVDEWLSKAASNTDSKAILPAPERPIDLFYGMSLGGTTSFGLRLAMASFRDDAKKNDGPTDKSTKKAEQVDLGFGLSLGSGPDARTDLGLSAGLIGTLKSSTDTATIDTSHSFKRGPELGFSFRNLGRLGAHRRFVVARAVTRSPEVKADNGTTSESGKFSEKGVQLEGGVVITPQKKTSISVGLGLLNFQSKGPIITNNTGIGSSGTTAATPSILTNDSKVKKTTNLLYSSLALETPVTESFGVLGGLEYNLFGTVKTKDDFNTGKPETEVSVEETPDMSLWSLGCFFEQAALRIDANYTKKFLHSTPYLISGDPTPSVLGRISLTYKI
jgi:hypothetical protein